MSGGGGGGAGIQITGEGAVRDFCLLHFLFSKILYPSTNFYSKSQFFIK